MTGAGLAIIAVIFLVNHFGLMSSGLGGAQQPSNNRPRASFQRTGRDTRDLGGRPLPSAGDTPASEETLVDFVHFLVDDIQGTWEKIFAAQGLTYKPARLVLFSDAVNSACGFTTSAAGPFYCPLDQKIYIDLSFYRELARKFRAPGDFAQAYVIAHEFGHHIQTVLGISKEVRSQQMRNPSRKNELSVKQELQADCFAGLWGHQAAKRNMLEGGDLEEGLTAASAIGDDNMQKRAGAKVRPESFTHGSSAQRIKWLNRGLQYGEIKLCDPFAE